MDKIGAILKERRQELDYSLSDMSEKTKLTVIQLEAIETGDIQFFKDDLSYLSYFVRYYSNALGMDFNEIRNQLEDSIMAYTDSISLSKVKDKEEMSQRVLHKTTKGNRAKKNIDFSSIGLFIITVVVILLLAFVVWKVVIPALGNKDPIEPPVVQLPNDPDDPEETPEEPTDEEPEPEPEDLTVTAVDGLNYDISGWQEDEELTINLEINNRSWIQFSEDGVPVDAPSQGIYEKNENLQVIFKAKKDKVLSANVGYFNGNVFSLNGDEIDVAAEIANSPSDHVINFKLIEGESTE